MLSFVIRLVGGKIVDRIGLVFVFFGGILVVIIGYVFFNYRIFLLEFYISVVFIGVGFGFLVFVM